MLVRVNSGAVMGVDGYLVEVEVDLGPGLQVFHIVGLPDGAIREARLRVPAAIENAGFEFPDDRITVNLAPADIRKDGTNFDLPIAVGVLKGMGYIRRKPKREIEDYLFVGELSLDGAIRPVRGVLSLAILARDAGYKGIVVPEEVAQEAALVTDIEVVGLKRLEDVVSYFNGTLEVPLTVAEARTKTSSFPVDFAEVVGQSATKRGLEIAAAGGHNVLMLGPPGSGKSMLARRLPTILPDMTFEESLETTKVHSVAGLGAGLVTERPFRAPHHTISEVGIVGGGSGIPRPGEVSLAHNGVLFLDEMPEFRRGALEVLRQPLEDGIVAIRRAMCGVTYPSNIMLVGAMNPCPCGYHGASNIRRCTCSEERVRNYRARISGPLLDRLDLQIRVDAVPVSELSKPKSAERSEIVRDRVSKARRRQASRYAEYDSVHCNAQMTPQLIDVYCRLDEAAQKTFQLTLQSNDMSARAYTRILKVARTIADLEGAAHVSAEHIGEAVRYRMLDSSKKYAA